MAALKEERELLWRAWSPDTLVAWAEPQLEHLLREVSRRAWGWDCPCTGSRRGEERPPASHERPSPSEQPARGQGWGGVGREAGVLAAEGSCCSRSSLRVGLREKQPRRAVSGMSRGEEEERLRALK